MGYYLQVDTKDPEPIASLSGWGDVIRWVGSLPPDAKDLHHLSLYGWTGEVSATTGQLAQFLKSDAPKSHETEKTLKNLLVLLKAADGAEVVSITDGLGEGE